MSKYLRYTAAEIDPMYISIRDKCAEHLTEKAATKWTDVLDELNLSTVGDSIVWDRIVRKMVEENYGGELIGVNRRFFKKRRSPSEKLVSTQLAGPYGPVVGWALLCSETEELYLAKLEMHQNQKAGMQKVVDKLGDECIKKGIDTTKIQKITGKVDQPRIEDRSNDEAAPTE